MGDVDKILNQDIIRKSVDDLCDDMKDLDEIVFIHLLWANKDGQLKGRNYGNFDALLAGLAKSQFMLLRHEMDSDDDD